ncbi:MAG: Gfo/Idh/MocA family oxidoreductase [Candidatus Hodarchaeota archaeon]
MKKVAVIGAGNIGSRHLQALKSVNVPIEITVVDPNSESLKIAQERYNSMSSGQINHPIKYYNNYELIPTSLDIAIIATYSTNRRKIIEQLYEKSYIKSFILEKILFNKAEDYHYIKNLLDKHKSQAWVNCTRRSFPFYQKIKNWFQNKQIIFVVSGSKWKLMSNLIHFIDYMAYVLNNYSFSIDFNHLDLNLIKSNVPGFFELEGTVKVYFNDGSIGIFNSYPSGEQPVIIDIISDDVRCIINEIEQKTLVNWSKKEGWDEYESKVLYTSQLTTKFVEDIINNNQCQLTPYNNSMELHLLTYEPLLNHLNENSENHFDFYPFT